ncbi:MAG: FAD-dependent oxidoreductase [Candidatus Hodarchaeales archaeon]|jgi:heterodisulfide reductase subunit A
MNPEEPPEEELRIGVFVCDCGSNIAGVVDTQAVTDYSATLADVVHTKNNRYTCADPGQEEIIAAIKEHGLNRVIVASCSPKLHEPTFRRTVASAGLNEYLFEMANIREHVSWVHGDYPEEATEKAKEVVRMAVAKARHLRPLEKMSVPVTKRAMVIGGGVSGLQSALDLADQGYEVVLVERGPTIGGKMALLDKTFPTLDCSICIEGPMMADAGKHLNIKLMSMSEVVKVDGYIGNFEVTVRKNPRFIIEDKCTGCAECVDVCPVTVPHEFDAFLGPRKAIYLPFPQAVPMRVLIDKESCIECKKCVEACGPERDAVDLNQEPVETIEKVGIVIVATGYDMYDPGLIPQLGYGQFPNVITAWELERLVNASGPTLGKVIMPNSMEKPHHVVFMTCVGSRNVNRAFWCSGFCCMYTVKLANLLKEKYKDALDISVLYMDMRTNFKDYEEFYQRARAQGIRFIRARPSEIQQEPKTGELLIPVESDSQLLTIRADMVVLSNAAMPAEGTVELGQAIGISRSTSGFFLEAHPKLKPVDTATAGVFLAGATQGPKDIPYSVSQGSAAASRAARVLSQEQWPIEPIVSVVDPDACTGCGACIKVCPYSAISIEEPKTPPVIVNPALCQGCGNCVAECRFGALDQQHFTDQQLVSQIRAALAPDDPIDASQKIVTFACNWCSYGGSDTAGVSRFQQKTNVRVIRTMCSGRISPRFVYEAFRLGAGGVMVTGCHINDCHYISANHQTERRFKNLGKRLSKMGIAPERFRLEWISASEGEKWQQTVNEMCAVIEQLASGQVPTELEAAKPALEKQTKKLHAKVGAG